jgi:hypothetical protein
VAFGGDGTGHRRVRRAWVPAARRNSMLGAPRATTTTTGVERRPSRRSESVSAAAARRPANKIAEAWRATAAARRRRGASVDRLESVQSPIAYGGGGGGRGAVYM